MKTISIIKSTILSVALMASNMAVAQTDQKVFNEGELKKTEKIEILKNRLMLDDATYAKFNSLYTKYSAEMKKAIEKTESTLNKERKEIAAMSDQELDAITFARVERNLEIATIHAKYSKEFKKILTSRQLHSLVMMEMRGNKDRMYAQNGKKGTHQEMGRGGHGYFRGEMKGGKEFSRGNRNSNRMKAPGKEIRMEKTTSEAEG